MIAVIFEVEPAENQADTYLELAAELRPLLDNIEGFISIERFTSLANPTKFLSFPSGKAKNPSDNGATSNSTAPHRQRAEAESSTTTASESPK